MATLSQILSLEENINDAETLAKLRARGDLVYDNDYPRKYGKLLINISRTHLLFVLHELTQKQVCYLLVDRGMRRELLIDFLLDPIKNHSWLNKYIKIKIKTYQGIKTYKRNYVRGERVHDIRILLCDWKVMEASEYQNFAPIDFTNDNQKVFLIYLYSYLTNKTVPKRRCLIIPNALTFAVLFGPDDFGMNLAKYIHGEGINRLGNTNIEKELEEEAENEFLMNVEIPDNEAEEEIPTQRQEIIEEEEEELDEKGEIQNVYEQFVLFRFKQHTRKTCLYVLIPKFYTAENLFEYVWTKDEKRILYVNKLKREHPRYNVHSPLFYVTEKNVDDNILNNPLDYVPGYAIDALLKTHPERLCYYYTHAWSELSYEEFQNFKITIDDVVLDHIFCTDFTKFIYANELDIPLTSFFVPVHFLDEKIVLGPRSFGENYVRAVKGYYFKLKFKRDKLLLRYRLTDCNQKPESLAQLQDKFNKLNNYKF